MVVLPSCLQVVHFIIILPTVGKVYKEPVARATFKYRREEARKRIIYGPIVKLSLKSMDGRWYMFTAYVDSAC